MTTQLIKSLVSRIVLWGLSPSRIRFLGEPIFSLFGRRSPKQQLDLPRMQRVLVVRLDRVGDVILTTPFLRELRRNLPHAQITLVVQPVVFNLMECCPYVDRIVSYALVADAFLKGGNVFLRQVVRAFWLARTHLWNERIELAIIPRWETDRYLATFVAYFSGARWRVGYSEHVTLQKSRLNRGYDALLTHPFGERSLKHEVEHNVDVIRLLGGHIHSDALELWDQAEDVTFADDLWKSAGLRRHDRVIAIAPGASTPERMWPLEWCVRISEWLQQHEHTHILLIGGPGEEALGQPFQGRVINVINASLRQTFVVLKRCALFIGNNSGPMHVAAAAGIPVVAIFSTPANSSADNGYAPTFFRPWGVPSIVLQPEHHLPPCEDGCIANYAHCIGQITVEQVKHAVAILLPKPSGKRS